MRATMTFRISMVVQSSSFVECNAILAKHKGSCWNGALRGLVPSVEWHWDTWSAVRLMAFSHAPSPAAPAAVGTAPLHSVVAVS